MNPAPRNQRGPSLFAALLFLLSGWGLHAQPAVANRVLELDGKDSYVELSPNLFNGLEEATVEGWMKWQSLENWSRFFDFGTNSQTMAVTIFESTAQLDFEIWSPAGSQHKISAPGMVQPGEWRHIAAVSGKGGMKLYVNGTQVAGDSFAGSFAAIGNGARNYLGRNNWKESDPKVADLHGQMDEVRVWRVARTAAQIRENMFKNLTGNEPDLAGLWNFEDGSANDASPAAHHGKLMGQAKVVEAALPAATALVPWSRLLVRITDAGGTALQNVTLRAEVDGTEVGRAISGSQDATPLTVWTTAPAVDLAATGTNDLGGWRLSVPITPYIERTNDVWKLGGATHMAGRAVALDGKTPHSSLVVELVQPDGGSSRGDEVPSSTPNSSQSLLTSAATNRVLHLPSDGSSVELPPGIFDHLTEVTVEGWMNFRDMNRWRTLFSYGNMAWRGLWFGVDDRNVLIRAGIYFGPDQADWRHLVVNIDIRSNEWIHVAFSTGSAGQRLFLNGVLMETNSLNGSFATIPKGSMHSLGHIAGGTYLHGQIDEWRVWDVGRTELQIRENMIKRMVGNEPGLVGLWNFDDPANPGRDATPGAHHGQLMGEATVTNAALPVVVFGNITDVGGKPLANASVEIHQPGQPDRRITPNVAGEYAFTISSAARCDLFVTTGKLSAYRLGFRPGGEGAQKLDWTLAETESAVPLDGSRRGNEADTSSNESRDVRLLTSATSFPAGTVITNMLTDENGAFDFPNLKPGAYQLRAHVLGGKTWFDGGKILHVRSEMPEAEIARLKNLTFPLAPFKKWRLQTIARWPGMARTWALHIHEAPDGAVWFPMLAGVARYDGAELRQFTTEDGLPTPTIRSVLAETNGVVWLGTDRGVIRYHWSAATNTADRAEVFDKVDGQPIGRVEALARTTDGTLWAWSINALFRFQAGTFEKFEGVPGHDMRLHQPLAAGPGGELWVANEHGLFRVVGTNVSHWTKNEGLPTTGVDSPRVAPDGAVWFQVWNHGVGRFDGTNFTFVSMRDGLPSDWVFGTQVDKDGVRWTGTSQGLARYDGDSMVVLKREDGLLHNIVHDVRQTADGALWLATESGVQRLELDGPRIWSLGDGLKSAEVNTVLSTRDGSIWAGTQGGGAARLRENSLETLTTAEGLGGDYVFSLWEDRDGTVWLGGGTDRLDQVFGSTSRRFLATLDGQQLSVPKVAASLPTNAVGITAMLRDAQGRLWLASPPVGLTRIGAGEPEVFGKSQGLPSVSTAGWDKDRSIPLAVLARAGSKLWIGTRGGGLAEYDGEKFHPVRPPGPWLIDETILCLLEEPDGGLWMGTGYGGAGRWDGKHFTLITARDARLGGNRVAAIHRDRRGWLWFGTDGGLTCYDGTTWRTFDHRDGLPEGAINALAEDAHGALWLGTSAGLARYQPVKAELRTPTLRVVRGAEPARTDPIHATQDRELAFAIGVVEFRTRPELRRFRWKAVAGQPNEAELSAASGWSEPITSPRFNWVPATRGLHTLAVQFMDRDLNRSPLGLATVNVAPLWYANAWIMAPGGGLVLGLFGWAFVARSLVIRRKREAEQLREEMAKRDREARARLEKEVGEREQAQKYFQSLVENVPVMVYRRDLEGRHTFMNRLGTELFAKLFGPRGKEAAVIGQGYDALDGIVTPEEIARAKEVDQEVIRTGRLIEHEFKFERRDGPPIWLHAIRTPVLAHDGRVTGVQIVTWDVTKEKEAAENLKQAKDAAEAAREQAEAANAAKSEFLANMSHEIRTPMNAILGFSELLRTQMAASKERQYLDAISSSGRTLLTLINDILDLSKIEAGKLELRYEPVAVARVVDEIQKVFSIKAAEKGVQLLAEIDPKLPRGLLLDEVRLRQVLFNVVGNALKFTDKGHVKVRAWAESGSTGAPPVGFGAPPNPSFHKTVRDRGAVVGPGGGPTGEAPVGAPGAGALPGPDEPDETRVTLILEVSDTGIGIPQAQQEHIFGAFAQVAGQSTRKFGGTGLGLAITKRLAEMMGGIIAMESEPGQGSTFRFTFPNVAITELAAAGTAGTDGQGGFDQFAPATILVADDVALNRALLAGYLEGTAHKLVTATNGVEALAAAEKHRPDVILMDMRMPELDGHEATRRLKANPALKHIPVIAVTASSFREEEAKARKICDGFIRKPFNRAELIAELQRFLKPAPVQPPVSAATTTGTAAHALEEPLDPDVIAKRPELLGRLQTELRTVWPRLGQTMEMGEIEQFAGRLKALAASGQWTGLRVFAEALEQQAQQFDLDRLPQTLQKFPEVVEQLTGNAAALL